MFASAPMLEMGREDAEYVPPLIEIPEYPLLCFHERIFPHLTTQSEFLRRPKIDQYGSQIRKWKVVLLQSPVLWHGPRLRQFVHASDT